MNHRLLPALLLAWVSSYAAQDSALDQAVSALQSGDLPSAERILRKSPATAESLSVLGVVLDQEKKYAEAEAVYSRALALTPLSVPLLNNYGNHLLATGKPAQARALFLRVVKFDAAHANAETQLARIALEQHQPAAALTHLNHLQADAAQAFDPSILRMQADYALHRDQEADQIRTRLSDGGMDIFVLGRALASVAQYGKALPLLEAALQAQPGNVDAIYETASVHAALNHQEQALRLSAQAAQLAPQRAGIQRLLARTSGALGFTGDSVQAWKRYTQLAPEDDEGRRELGFAETAQGDSPQGRANIKWYVDRHPDDAIGHYEWGTALAPEDPVSAMRELNRALTLKPNMLAAYVSRGILKYRQGQFIAALQDFQAALQGDPDNAAILDRIGETYLALTQPQQAVPILRRALELAPRESRIYLHLGRALYGDGQSEEASRVLARFRELGPDRSTRPRIAGVVDFLSLPASEQIHRYRQGVEKAAELDPNDAETQTRYLAVLLDERNFERTEAVVDRLIPLHPSAALIHDAVTYLIAGERFASARKLIDASPYVPNLELDRAMATLHTVNATAALLIMDQIPSPVRSGDYLIARAQMLFSIERDAEANETLTRALAATQTRPELCLQLAKMLLQSHRDAPARRLLDAAILRFPENVELLELSAQLVQRKLSS